MTNFTANVKDGGPKHNTAGPLTLDLTFGPPSETATWFSTPDVTIVTALVTDRTHTQSFGVGDGTTTLPYTAAGAWPIVQVDLCAKAVPKGNNGIPGTADHPYPTPVVTPPVTFPGQAPQPTVGPCTIAQPTLFQTSALGVVTIVAHVCPALEGHAVKFYVKSGLTG